MYKIAKARVVHCLTMFALSRGFFQFKPEVHRVDECTEPPKQFRGFSNFNETWDFPGKTAFCCETRAKSQYVNGLPVVSIFSSAHSEAPKVTQQVSMTFSLAQNDAY